LIIAQLMIVVRAKNPNSTVKGAFSVASGYVTSDKSSVTAATRLIRAKIRTFLRESLVNSQKPQGVPGGGLPRSKLKIENRSFCDAPDLSLLNM
jgi:hypothetical protein